MSEYINVSRRTFLKGTAAVAGAALAGGAYEIVHPEGAVAEEAPIEVKNTYCDMCNHVPKCGIAASVKDARWCAWRRATSTRPTHLREGHFQLAGVVRSASHHVSHGAHEPEARVRPNGSPSPGLRH